jgi:peptidylprolyl isomerase
MRTFACLLAVVSLTACGGSSTTSSADLAMTSGDMAMGVVPTSPCLPMGSTALPYLSAAPVRSFDHADQTTQSGKDYLAAVDTDAGCLVIDLNDSMTPTTTNSFVFLALHHFFEGIAFHRVIDGFVAQGGDPNTVDGSPDSWGLGDAGYNFGLEVNPALNYDMAGVVGMARSSDPNTNSSQFFITLAAATELNQMYTIFGKVTVGLDVLPKIVRGEPPTSPTRIKSVVIATK